MAGRSSTGPSDISGQDAGASVTPLRTGTARVRRRLPAAPAEPPKPAAGEAATPVAGEAAPG